MFVFEIDDNHLNSIQLLIRS